MNLIYFSHFEEFKHTHRHHSYDSQHLYARIHSAAHKYLLMPSEAKERREMYLFRLANPFGDETSGFP